MPRRRNAPSLELLPEYKNKNGSVEKPVWAIKYFDEGAGRQKTKRTGYGASEGREAEEYYAKWMMARTSEEPVEKNRANAQVPIAEVISHFLDEKVNVVLGDGRKPLSRPKEVASYMIDLLDWWGDKTVNEVNKRNCKAYWAHCSSHGAARNKLEYLRNAINLAHKDDIIDSMVTVHLPEKASPREDYFERSDIAVLMRACLKQKLYTHNVVKSARTGLAGTQVRTTSRPRRHLMAYIVMATYTGTRSHRMFTASFIKEVGRPWIDLERGVFHRAAPGEKVAPKKQAPSIKIPMRLLRHMRRWYRLGRRYPIEYNGKPVKGSGALGRLIKECFPDRNLVPHSFRHTAATWLMGRPELSLNDISGFLGMSIEMLDRVYGKHRVHHQSGIDNAITVGGIGKIAKAEVGDDDFRYNEFTPRDTGINKSKQAEPSRIKMSQYSQKTRKNAA